MYSTCYILSAINNSAPIRVLFLRIFNGMEIQQFRNTKTTRIIVLCLVAFTTLFLFHLYLNSDEKPWFLYPHSLIVTQEHETQGKHVQRVPLVQDHLPHTNIGNDKSKGLFPINLSKYYKGQRLYPFAVVADNSSGSAVWDTFFVNGWESLEGHTDGMTCCFRYSTGSIIYQPFKGRTDPRRKNADLIPQQFICPKPDLNNFKDQYNNTDDGKTIHLRNLVGVAVTRQGTECPTADEDYAFPDFLIRQEEDKIAICAKIAHGDKDAIQLLEWLEFQLMLGANKIFFYKDDNLVKDSMDVLDYYERRGLVEAMPLNRPEMEQTPRSWSEGQKGEALRFSDVQMMLVDSLSRMSTYKYGSTMDSDEFLVPSEGSHTYVEFMDKMLKKYPNASGFYFLDKLHVLDWGKTNSGSDIFMSQYSNQSEALYDRTKNIFLLDRMVHQKIFTHEITSRPGFTDVAIPENLATLHHYRSCPKIWSRKPVKDICKGTQRYKGEDILQFIYKIENNIRKARSDLNLSVR